MQRSIPKNYPVDRSKLTRNQARNCSQSVCGLVHEIMISGHPADRILTRFYRLHHRFGAADRRYINESLFSLFRWWGWLRYFLPADHDWKKTIPEHLAEKHEWLAMIASAHLLDNEEISPITKVWMSELNGFYPLGNLTRGWKFHDLTTKAEFLQRNFALPKCQVTQLIPEWALKMIALSTVDLHAFIEILQKRPPLWLRSQNSNLLSLIEELKGSGLTVQSTPHHNQSFCILHDRVNLQQLPAFRAGKFEVQDLASQGIGLTCNAKPGDRWWDVCAGAGGKSVQLGHMMRNQGTIVATDIREWKLTTLKQRARRAHLHNISTRQWNKNKLPSREANFDGVLVDAPCSCSGTWRRNPDARWTSQPDELTELCRIQTEILAMAAHGVKPGGQLIYATCSIFACENHDIINQFLSGHKEFRLVPFKHPFAEYHTDGTLTIWSHQYDSDCIFAAKLQKNIA